MAAVSALRAVVFAFQNFWRNIWLSLITVSLMMFTLLIVNALVALSITADRAIAFVEQKVEVSVYFNAGTPESRVADAAGYLRGLAQVRDVSMITPDEALERFKKRHVRDAAILQSLEEVGHNPFGPTLVVKARSTEDFPFVLEALDNPKFRDDIRDKDFSDYEGVINRIRSITDQLRVFGFILALAFLMIATLIVFNAVRLALVIHREEIGIMKLVGASDSFVRAPFLIETLIYSVLATAITAALTIPAVAFMDPYVERFFEGMAPSEGLLAFYQAHGVEVFVIECLAMTFVAMCATSFAMRKYLKV